MDNGIGITKLKGNETPSFGTQNEPLSDFGLGTRKGFGDVQGQSTVQNNPKNAMDDRIRITKLRGNEREIFHSRYRPFSDFGEGQSTVQNNLQSIPLCKSQQPKCGGRGMFVQQIAQTITTFQDPFLNFSNTNIERHFNKRKEQILKEQKEKNEKTWGKMIGHLPKNG